MAEKKPLLPTLGKAPGTGEKKPYLAIIGGTGLLDLADLEGLKRVVARTPYGDPSGPLTMGTLAGVEVVFLARHGYGHTLPPHEINYRANLWALREKGVTHAVGVCSVGGIGEKFVPGIIALPDQIIDYTFGRKSTFFETTFDSPVVHVDFTWPFSSDLREKLLEAARAAGETLASSGTYGATQGPRLETAAEIERMARDGADLVGMTAMPEAALAREAGIEYAIVCPVVNWAAGRGESHKAISAEAIEEAYQEVGKRIPKLLAALVERFFAIR